MNNKFQLREFLALGVYMFRSRTPRNRKKAQGLLEFAMVLPLLLLLVFGVIGFGHLLFIYSSVITASREAARYGSAAGDNGSGTLYYMDCPGIQAAARRVSFLTNVTSISINYDSGPGTSSLGGCPPSFEVEGGKHRIVVEVIANYQPIVPLVNINSFNIRSRSARTIFSNIVVGRFPPNPAHVGDLHGEPQLTSPQWKATVTILVMDEEGGPVGDATVVGEWSRPPRAGSCLTVADGSCTVTKTGIPNNNVNNCISFTVADILHTAKTYDPTANTDLDGDSDGTTIWIRRPLAPPGTCP